MSADALSTSIDLPKITIIYDNKKTVDTLTEGFGFSCLIEWNNRKILFDTGGKGEAFFSNVQKLGINLETITHAIFSHKHWDHTAAFKDALALLKNSPVLYLPDEFDSSLEAQIPKNMAIHKVKECEEIDQNIFSLVLSGSYWLTTVQEQAIVLRTTKGLVILTGCAHPGIDNIARAALSKIGGEIHLIIGGFHLAHSWKRTCENVVEAIRKLGVEKVAPCHCAGERAESIFSNSYGQDFIETGVGSVIQI